MTPYLDCFLLFGCLDPEEHIALELPDHFLVLARQPQCQAATAGAGKLPFGDLVQVVRAEAGERLDSRDGGDGHGGIVVDLWEHDNLPVGDPGVGTWRGTQLGVVEDLGDVLDFAQGHLLADVPQPPLEHWEGARRGQTTANSQKYPLFSEGSSIRLPKIFQ